MPTVQEVYELLRSLKSTIGAGDRSACVDEDQDCFDVTVSYNSDSRSWHYQTGDNSFSGACYGDPFWSVVVLTRRSNCLDLARSIVNELKDRASEFS